LLELLTSFWKGGALQAAEKRFIAGIVDLCINNAIHSPSGGNMDGPTEGKCGSA
jgi:hypothetical protein